MSGHEFEKQVRQKLNDLKMTPSAESWENIEGRLRERKRRPVIFYWLPLLLIGLAAGGYLILNNDQTALLSDRTSTHNVTVQPKQSDNNAVSPVTGGVLRVAPQEKTTVTQEKISSSQQKSNKEHTSGGIYRNVKPGTQIDREEKSVMPADISSAAPQKDLNTLQNNTIAPQEKNAAGRNLSLKIANYPIGTITPSPLNFTQTTKKTADKKSKKWSYGLSAFAGISAVNEGHLLNFNNAQVEDVSQVPSFAPQPSYKPSSISPGMAYSGGLFVRRELNKKFAITLGANYLQLNTRSKVGNREYGAQVVNAGSSGYQVVSSFFRVERDRTSEYHNRYHFIEVPMELHTRLNRSARMPIQLNTGVAVSQLLKSTSLHFDGTTGVYYKDDRLLNQTQLAAKTGVSIGILNKTKRPLWIGPSAKYNISKILKKDVSARTNFMSVGVDVKMFIK
jgi:hypothetical protein